MQVTAPFQNSIHPVDPATEKYCIDHISARSLVFLTAQPVQLRDKTATTATLA